MHVAIEKKSTLLLFLTQEIAHMGQNTEQTKTTY